MNNLRSPERNHTARARCLLLPRAGVLTALCMAGVGLVGCSSKS